MHYFSLPEIILICVFAIGYCGIIFEFALKVNKTAVALILAVSCWMVFFVGSIEPMATSVSFLTLRLSKISQILFFLIGAMTLVELIDSHRGFDIVIQYITTRSKRKLLWLISIITFFMSALLDNLATTILMITLLRRLVPDRKERFLLLIMVVVSANAGGAWTPIGDVTTTLLWISGQISSLKVMNAVFLPSLVSMLVPLLLFSFTVKGRYGGGETVKKKALEPGAHMVFFCGMLGFVFVPAFKALTGMPPFMGILIALGVMWVITDLMHHKDDTRHHLRVPHILTKIDVTSILFFLGILLSVDAIEAVGLLEELAMYLSREIGNEGVIATLIGIFSAIIDNVPLVQATIGMYDLRQYPMDSNLWLMIAYAAGTGGSIFVIGSAAGVACMGMEKIDFVAYMKKASIPVFLGYLIGMGIYLIFSPC